MLKLRHLFLLGALLVGLFAQAGTIVLDGNYQGKNIFVQNPFSEAGVGSVSYTHLRAHETVLDLVCRLLLEKKKHQDHRWIAYWVGE